MKKRLIYFFASSLLAVTQLGCKDQYSICDLSKDVFFKAGFYSITGGNEVINNAPEFSLKPLNISNFTYQGQMNITSFVLSLDPLLDSNRYYIKFGNLLPADTLTLVYSTSSAQLSAECGIVSVYNITKAYSTSHTIDSVRVTNPTVNTGSLQNIRLFFQQ